MVLSPLGRERPAAEFGSPHKVEPWPLDPEHAKERRTEALRRAKVWQPSNVARVDFSHNPSDSAGTLSDSIVRCRFLPKSAHGTTPKFDCVLPDGEIVKVKYGLTSEIPAEIVASRLLAALGFGADQMFLVPRVRCYGCPHFPFYVTWALDRLSARDALTRHLPDDRYTDFEWAAVERHRDGATIETDDARGWAWYELDQIDPSSGGASRAEVDALRLIAMFLVHWDNKAENQRLACLDPRPSKPAPCRRPFAFVHDLGATFGPSKIDIDRWQATPMWLDAQRCTIGMKSLPYGGGTFADTPITEGGRRLILRQLQALSEAQIVALFASAHVDEFHWGSGSGVAAQAWTAAFRNRVRQIADGGPCPAP
jgi:hypothetical protein